MMVAVTSGKAAESDFSRLAWNPHEITDEGRGAVELRDREEWFQSILESIPHMIWVARPDGTGEFTNRQLQTFTGVSGDALRGEGWRQLIHPDDVDVAVTAWRNAYRAGHPYVFLHRVRRHDGEYRWFEARATPVRDREGVVVRWIGTWTDVHERVAAETAVRESERLYRAIGESIDYGVWVCAPDGGNTYASDSFLKLVGLTQEQCSGFGWGEVLHPDDAARTIAAWKECARTGGTWDVEHRLRGVDGQWHPVLARSVPVRNEKGEVICWVGINLDISGLKRAQQRLLEADRRKNEYIGMLSHELRNPLAAIQSAHAILERTGPATEQAARAREVIGRQVRHLARLVDDLLDVTRISRGKVQLQTALVDLGDLVRHVVEDHRPIFANSGVALELREPGGAIFVQGDVARLSQVVGNLLQNAAKFTSEGGHVQVLIEPQGQQAVIQVQDDGLGIDRELVKEVFEPFMQADRTLSRAQGGLGLGLALVKGITELHGGSVEARSDGEGRGSQFVVRLPLADSGQRSVVSSPGGSVAPRHILVIEDNEDAALTMRDLLELEGHRVTVARDGPQGLEAAAREQPDVVLCDVGLPTIDGYVVAARLRAAHNPALLIALTGYASPEDAERARQAGFDHHLAKPVDPGELASLMAAPRGRGRA
jgi:PAS domain S-box-containing protein